MFCAQCGLGIDDDSRFCRHCGASQTQGQVATVGKTGVGQQESLPPDARSGGPNSATWILGGVMVAGLLLAVVIDGNGASSTTDNLSATEASFVDGVATSHPSTADPAATASSPPPPTENWSYSTDEDRVRGANTYYARTTSTNSIHQNAPYDDATTMTITVRRSPGFGRDVLLTVSSGQLMCPSYEGCSGTVRFDRGPAQRISFNGAADNSSDTIFVGNAASFIARLKKARKLVIEKTMYEAGNPQFEFDVAGLHWGH